MIDGFVLAGGRSRRMGEDKARLRFPGHRPMAVEVARALAAVCDRVVIVRRGDDGPFHDDDGRVFEVLVEPDDGEPHPLRGLAVALAAARGPIALVVACDLPFVRPETLRTLAEAALAAGRPAVAGATAGPQPLLGAWPVDRAAAAARAAAAGASARSFAADARVVRIADAELRNVNRPEDRAGG